MGEGASATGFFLKVWDVGYSWLQISNNSLLLATCFGRNLPKRCETWRNLPVLAKFMHTFGDFAYISMFRISVGYRIWLKVAPHFYL
jgi:hypothetical protein